MIEKPLFRALLPVVAAVVVSSCMFSRLDDDLDQLEEVTHVFSGTVSMQNSAANTLVVIALRDQQGSLIAGFRIVPKSGLFEIKSNPQPLWIFAFNDLNRDLVFQANEPYGWGNRGQAVDPAITATDQLLIEIIATPGNLPTAPPDLINIPLADHITDIVQFQVGTVTPLNDPIFSQEQAEKGLWQPFAFMVDGGTGIHFIEAYDPNRIPVLFVHGISDTPRRFTALIESLDHSRYQAWVFSYPSGLGLSLLAKGMYRFLTILHLQYPFDQLHIVAHSMGGLVSRGGVNECVQEAACSYLRSYTTISTPWNGVASARSGVEWAPTVVPVWRDLDPDNDYLATLFDDPLPEGVPYNLIFGFKQNSIFGSESSDGVIKLSSQLRNVAQEQASRMRGYDEDHVSILSNESVIAQLNEILDANSQ